MASSLYDSYRRGLVTPEMDQFLEDSIECCLAKATLAAGGKNVSRSMMSWACQPPHSRGQRVANDEHRICRARESVVKELKYMQSSERKPELMERLDRVESRLDKLRDSLGVKNEGGREMGESVEGSINTTTSLSPPNIPSPLHQSSGSGWKDVLYLSSFVVFHTLSNMKNN